ncbi:MAG: M48 family metalloprotease [Gemmatimonadota bacterium]|nr:M48 family metalloprotease [Gemmatimonadota bacterium]
MPTILTFRVRRWAAAAMCATALAGCARNPVTGRNELALISESQEIELGRQSAQQVEQSIGLVADAELQSYVQGIGAGLAAESERPELPWTFRVVDDPTPNAFALPGGFIFVTRGLLSLMDSEAELASVLGHEIGHVTARHSVAQISRAQLAQLGLGIGMVLSETLRQYGDLASSGLQLLFLKYGRDAERQADDLGFRYALTEGYDVRDMVDVFTALQRAGELAKQSALPAWLATHPYPEERIERTRARIAALDRPTEGLTLDRAKYLESIEGMVYGVNPRNGFFQGTTFLHPDLRFRINFPQGWQVQNLAQAVVGVSPRQDAVIQLTLAGSGDPANAARQFLGQQGIQPGRATRETINGVPAVASYFQAQTEQGVLAGLVVFFAHGGRTYQVLGYAPGQQFSAYDPLLRQSLGSFGPLTDPRTLAIQPNQMDIIRLEQGMTLAQFNQRYPSPIPLPELALINQVSGEGAMLPAGTLAKRVTGTAP